jgi:hypothetical protein
MVSSWKIVRNLGGKRVIRHSGEYNYELTDLYEVSSMG